MALVQTKDMTDGNPVKLILIFALPILAGNMLQQLYSLVDSLIIGRLLGVTALTAVSASGWLDWAVLVTQILLDKKVNQSDDFNPFHRGC